MKILVIDNYDSFTYNLVHLINECGQEATVWRNDRFEIDDVMLFDKILLSPGPGIPSEAGLLMEVLKRYATHKSILGICLGMQAIAENFGGKLYNLKNPVHGKATEMKVVDRSESLFAGLPANFKVGRYHSWAVTPEELPTTLEVTATSADEVVMALSHQSLGIKGVQFHPESVLTEYGKQMMQNWLNC